MFVVPTPLVEVMSSTSAMAPRWRSKGVATVAAMTSGLAPGRLRGNEDGRNIDARQGRDRQQRERRRRRTAPRRASAAWLRPAA